MARARVEPARATPGMCASIAASMLQISSLVSQNAPSTILRQLVERVANYRANAVMAFAAVRNVNACRVGFALTAR